MFARFKGMKATIHSIGDAVKEFRTPKPKGDGKVAVDPSCNTTITISCLLQLYNAVGFKASAKNGNKVGITGYLGEFANNQTSYTSSVEHISLAAKIYRQVTRKKHWSVDRAFKVNLLS